LAYERRGLLIVDQRLAEAGIRLAAAARADILALLSWADPGLA